MLFSGTQTVAGRAPNAVWFSRPQGAFGDSLLIVDKEHVGPGFSPDKGTTAIPVTLSGLKPGPT